MKGWHRKNGMIIWASDRLVSHVLTFAFLFFIPAFQTQT